jgi:hypothetical protein
MISFIGTLGTITYVFGILACVFFVVNTNLEIGIAYLFGSLVSGSLLHGFSKHLEWTEQIKNALVDEEYGIEDMKENGKDFKIRMIRSRGKFGCTYQVAGVDSVRVEASFSTKDALLAKVRSAISEIA